MGDADPVEREEDDSKEEAAILPSLDDACV